MQHELNRQAVPPAVRLRLHEGFQVGLGVDAGGRLARVQLGEQLALERARLALGSKLKRLAHAAGAGRGGEGVVGAHHTGVRWQVRPWLSGSKPLVVHPPRTHRSTHTRTSTRTSTHTHVSSP